MPDSENVRAEEPLSRSEQFSVPFRWTFAAGFILVAFYAVANLALTAWAINDTETATLTKAVFTIRLVQVSLAMMIAFFTIFLGVLAAWMGIEAKFNVSGAAPGYGLTLASASPGILLILCGTTLIAICLLKPVTVYDRITETEPERAYSSAADETENDRLPSTLSVAPDPE